MEAVNDLLRKILILGLILSIVFIYPISELQKLHFLFCITASFLLFLFGFTSRLDKNSILFVVSAFSIIIYFLLNALALSSVNSTIIFYTINMVSIIAIVVSGKRYAADFLHLVLDAVLLMLIFLSWIYLFFLYSPESSGRFSFIYDNPNTYTLYLVVLSFIYTSNVINKLEANQSHSRRLIILCSLVVLSTLFFAFMSGSRKSIIAILPLFLFWFYYVIRRLFSRHDSNFLRLIFLSVFIVSGVALYEVVSQTPYIQRLLQLFDLFLAGEISTGSIDERFVMIDKAFKLWIESPIWGHGVDSFRELSGMGKYSHVNYLELLTNTGAVGFVLYYQMLIIAFFSSVISLLRSQGTRFYYAVRVLLILTLLSLDISIVTYHSPIVMLAIAILYINRSTSDVAVRP